MIKIISVELLNSIITALINMSGLTYVQIQGLIDEMQKCPDLDDTPKEEKKNGK